MIKRLVRHEHFGEGRVVAQDRATIRISFFDGISAESQVFASDAIENGFLVPLLLENGRRCEGPEGTCTVMRTVSNGPARPRSYEVLYENGVTAVCSEVELEPLRSAFLLTPGMRLAAREIGHLNQFRSRESFCTASIQNLRQGGSLAALLSARIQLHPHQAFVAGTILDDRRRRYILADEVGLGKTIEAGVVIHDILAANPGARVLIVCPGALTQQWFCEIYSKFSGRIFTLLDLHEESGIQWEKLQTAIVSMSQVLRFAANPLLAQTWDLVVVDECHHLLARPVLYDFAAKLSRKCRSLLLLSAVPAQQREQEYFKLLALLEPDKFDIESPESLDHFKHLFENQTPLSRRLQPLMIRMKGFKSGDYTGDDIVRQAKKLIELPVLNADEHLTALSKRLEGPDQNFLGIAQQIVDHVVDKYRVYRRILRNRRKALQQDLKVDLASRAKEIRTYPCGNLELAAEHAVEALLGKAWNESEEPEIVLTLARNLWQSFASGDCVYDLLAPILLMEPRLPNAQGREFLGLGHLIGYEEWSDYIELLQMAAAAILDRNLLRAAIEAVALWKDSNEQPRRCEHLIKILAGLRKDNSSAKILVFAGYPGMAEEIEIVLSEHLGERAIASFRAELSREEKEDAAMRFRSDPATFALISDETGGEGRNFEFADAVVLYDTPWQVSRVEQRIGRLDRIGRKKFGDYVLSITICAEGSLEHALVRCLDDGLNVYRESISGLEFSLREQERHLAEAALGGGIDALNALVPRLREVAQSERSRDEYDALLDWASFNEDRAQKYLRVRSRPEQEAALESTFVDYFQNMARPRAVGEYRDERATPGLWRFDLDALRAGILPVEASGKVIGTFRRETAQLRLDRDFFQIGNLLFDSICRAAEQHNAYRTYAVQCQAAGRPPWCGFEFVFCCRPDITNLESRSDLQQLARSYLPSAPVHVFLGLDGAETESSSLLSVRQSLTRQNNGRTWVNLWKERAAALDEILPESTWLTVVVSLEEKAKEIARSQFGARLALLEDRKATWLRVAKKFREAGTKISLEEAANLEMLHQSIADWEVYEESAGFLAINQELVRYA